MSAGLNPPWLLLYEPSQAVDLDLDFGTDAITARDK